MSGYFGIDSNREVIRVHVKKCDGLMQPESKKFSVDPQITSYEMLQNILAKAFDIHSEFTISYLSSDQGQEVYLSMLSDWDMDAAFQNASDPCLRLKVDLKPFDEALEDWDIIAPVEIPQYRMTFLDKNRFLGNITGTISNQVEKTVSHMQRVMGIKSEDEAQYRPIKLPMTDMEFRNYLDSDGHMVKPEEFRLSIYQGGVEPSLRRVVWRHLLNIYPADMSGRERFDYMKRKENEYIKLRDKWKDMFSSRQVSEEAKHVASLVKKDVLRTDRTHKFYSGGDESKNLISLYHLLVTYALTHPEVSYCQGMSDLASPLLVVQKEEAQAYLCFCGLMKRLRKNFKYDGEAITTKLHHLSTLVQFYDPVFQMYMKEHGAEDLFFCYRWLLLEMKREFPFDDALYMLEVMWSTLPPSPPDGGLELTDPEYSLTLLNLSVSPHSPSVVLQHTQYSHLLAKRRISTTPKADVPSLKSPKMCNSPKLNSSSLVNNSSVLNSVSKAPKVVKSPLVEEKVANTDVKHENDSTDDDQSFFTSSSVASSFSTTSSSVVNSMSNQTTGSCTSSLSNSISIDRFPTLISGSIEEQGTSDAFVNEIDSANSPPQPCETLVETGSMLQDCYENTKKGNQSDRKQEVEQNHFENPLPDEEENENQSQFYLSLEENDASVVATKKKSDIPQIKGSFFSGMKKILSSPKRKPGKAQQDHVNTNVSVQNGGNDRQKGCEGSSKDKARKVSDESNDSENTLFEMVSSATNIPKERSDTDSGNGSFTSSTNSSHVNLSKTHTATNGPNNRAGVINKNNLKLQGVNNIKVTEYEKNYKETLTQIPRSKQSLPDIGSQPVFCENHFDIIHGDETVRTDETKEVGAKDDGISDCVEVTDTDEIEACRLQLLPPPDEFGYGNPFLMFLCLSVLLGHRELVMKSEMEYDELAMYFDKMVRRHNVNKVLHQARHTYTEYIKMQQKKLQKDDDDFSV